MEFRLGLNLSMNSHVFQLFSEQIFFQFLINYLLHLARWQLLPNNSDKNRKLYELYMSCITNKLFRRGVEEFPENRILTFKNTGTFYYGWYNSNKLTRILNCTIQFNSNELKYWILQSSTILLLLCTELHFTTLLIYDDLVVLKRISVNRRK